MKIVINECFGGFGISELAAKYLAERGNTEAKAMLDGPRFYSSLYDTPRNDPILIEAVEVLGAEANGAHAKLKVVEVPDEVEWVIEEYDGIEWVAEVHRVWR
jgi:hypothetical protein